MNLELQSIQIAIDKYKENHNGASVGDLSDGYHSFNNLYEHRAVLLAMVLMKMPYAWKTTIDAEGRDLVKEDKMFLAGAPTPDGMISYHVNLELWDLYKIPEIPQAPIFNGYTEDDVLKRLTNMIMTSNYGRFVTSMNVDKIEQIVKDEILPRFGDDLVAQAAFIGVYNSVAVM